MRSSSKERFEWADKQVGEVLFDSLVFFAPCLLAVYAEVNTLREAGRGFAPLLIILILLASLTGWHFTSRRLFISDSSQFVIKRCILLCIPISKKILPRGRIKDLHCSQWTGFRGVPHYDLEFKMTDGSLLRVFRTTSIVEVQQITSRVHV